MSNGFLPISKQDMIDQGIEQLDFVYVCGDAYVDHPSFGHAIIARLLQAHGYTVGIISQPDWKDDESISILGVPRLGFLVSAGNMDSMVNHYSVSKKRRAKDSFTPGGVMGKRPDYATVVYCNLIRHTYKKIPIIIGGIEASLRRMAHYDYWSNKVKRSILLDSGADIISYGMGERSIIEIADALASGMDVKDITFIDGTVFKTKDRDIIYDAIELPDYDVIKEDKREFARSFYIQYCNTDPFCAKRLVEPYDNSTLVVQNPPQKPLSQEEMDEVYALPYMRTYHPSYEEAGGVPAISEVKFSLISNRGCFGGCNFCALTFHQGRIIQTRSHESIIEEAKLITQDKDFKGYIHDVGGPTANFRQPACKKQLTRGACPTKQCLFPKPCNNLIVDHSDYIQLLRELRALPKVKKVFIRSGIRFDYLMYDKDRTFLRELCEHHVPYLMSSHPGSTLKEAIELAEYLRDLGYMPEQVQDFYPTPSTISTCMYYTGLDPATLKPVYVTTNPHEKAMQRALIQYRNPKNYDLVHEALVKAGREDLIGFDKKCLIKPRKMHTDGGWDRKRSKSDKNSNSSYGSGKNAGVRKNLKNATERGKNGSGSNTAGTAHKKKTIRNVHKKKR